MSQIKQVTKTSQKQSPQQIMLNRLLVPIVELEKAVQEELANNALLEDETTEVDESASMNDNIEPTEQDAIDDGRGIDDDIDQRDGLIEESDLDAFDDDYSYRERQEHDRNSGDTNYDNFIASHRSLNDELIEQLVQEDLDEQEMVIAQEIIGSIDDRGYLGRNPAVIANDMEFKRRIITTEEEVIRILKIVQTFEPSGIAARDEQECLSIQLHNITPRDAAVETATTIIDRCFNELTKKRYKDILKTLNINDDDLDAALSIIKRLSLAPASSYSEIVHDVIVPDFYVTNKDGRLVVSLNNEHTPKLHVNRYYTQTLKDLEKQKTKNKATLEAINFIKDKSEDATLFIDALKLRTTALTATMKCIVKHQKHYFLSGDPVDIKPLLQKDVAEETGYDNSTISRIVNAKYVQTDFGLVRLDKFFSNAVESEDGSAVASAEVKAKLQEIVDGEDKSQPFTDEKLTEQLKQMGYTIARRTVMKYREALGIPSSTMRKELKK